MTNCCVHIDREALSFCHNCGEYYCEACLAEGKEYYYCGKPECQIALKKEILREGVPENVICPNCESELELSEEERISGKIHCPSCETVIDFNLHPPKVLSREKYVELLSSLNHGDIGLIKSILDDAKISYYVFGENFLSVDPLLQPARFFVNAEQAEEAKELLKNFDLKIWGVSRNQ